MQRASGGASGVDRRVLVAAAGAACIASSSMFVRLADASPATAAAFRCLLSVPLLLAIAWWQGRGNDEPRPRRARLLAAGAGAFFTLDLYFWHHCIADAGAGVATVLGNLQVLVVGAVAWALLGERPSSRLLGALPVVGVGVVFVSGIVGPAAFGEHPVRGTVYGVLTSTAYAGFILLLRGASTGSRSTAAPLLEATVVAGVLSIGLGAVTDGVDLAPPAESLAWLALLAVLSQVVGWLLISHSLPQLPAAVTSLVLLLQPLGALALAAVVLGERPTWVQLVGSALVLGGVVAGSRGTSTSRDPESAADLAPTALTATPASSRA